MARTSWKQRLASLWSDALFRTLVLINLASIMERADEALLPGVYREIGIAMHATPTALGTLTLLRSSVQVICFPLAAYASLHHSRAKVIALGAMLWSIATFFVGASSTFVQVAIWRALNAIGLALVIPAIQSLVADVTEAGDRGVAFGWVQFTGNFGGILGSICSVLLAGTTVLGIAGWRASFYLITVLSVVVGVLVYKYAIDPRFTENTIPIFAEIVPEKSRTSVYALDRSFESLLASFAPPIVGILAEHVFGYVASPSNGVALSANKKNAAALAKALYAAFGAPYTVCCLIFSVLYWTYPNDRDKARAEAQMEAEMEITGVIQSYNGKAGYASLKEEIDCNRVRTDEDETVDDLKASGEEQRMLPETAEP